MKKIVYLITILVIILFTNKIQLTAQTFDERKDCIVDSQGKCISNTVLSALPFLRITPNARSGGMGNVGIGLSPDANALFFNSSKLAFVDNKFGVTASYVPWSKNLGIKNIFLAHLSGFLKIDELQTFGLGVKYFSLGKVNHRDAEGNPTGIGYPKEYEISVSYNRKLSENLAIGITPKYIHSNLATGQILSGHQVVSAKSLATDISMTYKNKAKLFGFPADFTFGIAMTNLGQKITYIKNNTRKNFIPANIGMGSAVILDLNKQNSITFALDINKLMVPTPQARGTIDKNGNYSENQDFYDIRELSLIKSMVSSFSDAPGGFSEEVSEINLSMGIEYSYAQQIFFRAGYFYENPLKGDRQHFTMGVGIKYSSIGINFSYLAALGPANPLNRTFRVTVVYELDHSSKIKNNK